MKRIALGLGALSLTLSCTGCGIFDDPDRGECHGTIDGAEVSLSLDGGASRYTLEDSNDVLLVMRFTDGTTDVHAEAVRFDGPPSNLPLTPQPFDTALRGIASAWVRLWTESAMTPTRGTVDLDEATLTRMRGTFDYAFANDDVLQCTFDLRRSERRSSGDADSD